MNCPKCGSVRTRVVLTDTLPSDEIVRRRRCIQCDHRWYTHQPPEQLLPNHRIRWSHAHITLRPAPSAA